MNNCCRNYYKIGREIAGFTQEQASEFLGICVRSLSNYENGKKIPSDEIVLKMVDVYNIKLLGWWHLWENSPLVRKCLPEFQFPQTNADIFFQIQLAEDDISIIKSQYKKILSMEEITDDELKDYKMIQEKAKIIAGKMMSICSYELNIENRWLEEERNGKRANDNSLA